MSVTTIHKEPMQWIVEHDRIIQFGELTGDRSGLHLDPEIGRQAGYGGAIAHGLLTACWAVGAITQTPFAGTPTETSPGIQSTFSVRLGKVVCVGDQFITRILESDDRGIQCSESPFQKTTRFETLNQHGEQTSSGELSVRLEGPLQDDAAPEPWDLHPWRNAQPDHIFDADDLVRFGPRGTSLVRVISARHVATFSNLLSPIRPDGQNENPHSGSKFDPQIVPPMLSFSLAFSDFLRDLVSVRMPAQGFAGHIGDQWRLFRPIRVGERLRSCHQPLSSRPSKSREGMAIVHFGLQIIDSQGRVVQDGETVMMIPTRFEKL